jgi:hypothetical protein
MKMRSLFYSLPLLAALWQIAAAHNSLAPHSHPHGASPLLGLDVIFLAVLALAGLAMLFKPVRRAVIRVFRRR